MKNLPNRKTTWKKVLGIRVLQLIAFVSIVEGESKNKQNKEREGAVKSLVGGAINRVQNKQNKEREGAVKSPRQWCDR